MTKQERASLRKDILSAPRDSQAVYEMKYELSMLNMRLSQIKSALFDARFGKFYPSNIFDRFIFGKEDEKRVGGR